jgi:hypothetical protein
MTQSLVPVLPFSREIAFLGLWEFPAHPVRIAITGSMMARIL